MGCGCKKKAQDQTIQVQPQVVTINNVPTPVVTQPAATISQS